MIPYYLNSFLFLFNLLLSIVTFNNLIKEFKKKPGITYELLIGVEKLLLKLKFTSFQASLLLLLLPSINNLK